MSMFRQYLPVKLPSFPIHNAYTTVVCVPDPFVEYTFVEYTSTKGSGTQTKYDSDLYYSREVGTNNPLQ